MKRDWKSQGATHVIENKNSKKTKKKRRSPYKMGNISTISVVSSLPPYLSFAVPAQSNLCVCSPLLFFYRNPLFYLPFEEWIPSQLFAESNMLSGYEEGLSVSATGQRNRQTLNRWKGNHFLNLLMTLSCLPRAILLSNSTRNGYDPYPLVFGTNNKQQEICRFNTTCCCDDDEGVPPSSTKAALVVP